MVLRSGPRRRGLISLAVAASVALAACPAAAGETLSVVLDQAKVIKMPDGVSTVIVGNPLIADVSVQSGGLLVLTGKGYGVTNLLALDRNGAVVMERAVNVEGPQDNLIVYRGTERESYSCAPNCERRITLGDSPAYFNATLAQSGSRTGQAQAGAAVK
jgi:Flp pilus assembly secretin CpaC